MNLVKGNASPVYIPGGTVESGRLAVIDSVVPLSTDDFPVAQVLIQNESTSAAHVRVGNATRQDWELADGDSITLFAQNLSAVYIKFPTATCYVNWLATR